MRILPVGISAKLDDGVTTLAYAWRLTRKDGLVVAVTQHDRDLTFAGTTFVASKTLLGRDNENQFTLAPDRTALSGALNLDAINSDDLALGRWDNAQVTAFMVDWTNPNDHIAMWSGKVTGATWHALGFDLDIVGIEAALNTQIGRVYARTCEAILGDTRCGVDLANASRFADLTMLEQDSDRVVVVAAPVGKAVTDFAGGRLKMTSGALTGWQSDIASITAITSGQSTQWRVSLARAFPIALSQGDAVQILVGCDKTFATCKTRFANALNFRGQPTMPGNDVVFGGPAASGNTGGKR